MPRMGGMEASTKIKQIEDLQKTPIVALSADAFASAKREALDKGLDYYLTKPIDLNELVPVLKACLKLKEEKEATNAESMSDNPIPEDVRQRIKNQITALKKIDLLEFDEIIGKLNDIAKDCSGYKTKLPASLKRMEDAVYNMDEDTFKQLIEKALITTDE